MEITYRNDRDKIFYQSKKALSQAHGERMARKIIQRISELEAANNPQQIPRNARFHEHEGIRKGLFSIDLVHPFRLIIRPTCKYNSYIEIISAEIFEIYNPHK